MAIEKTQIEVLNSNISKTNHTTVTWYSLALERIPHVARLQSPFMMDMSLQNQIQFKLL
jgi:hypothetical protein